MWNVPPVVGSCRLCGVYPRAVAVRPCLDSSGVAGFCAGGFGVFPRPGFCPSGVAPLAYNAK